MTTPRTRKLIATAIALSIGFASAAAAADSNRTTAALPNLPVITVTPDAADLARAAGHGLPLTPRVSVTPDVVPVEEPGPVALTRERVADGRVLPRLPTVEVAATVAPVEPVAVVAVEAPKAAEPVDAGRARALRFGIGGMVGVRFTMPYYSFGNRSRRAER
jgi:hypothetical protein